MERRGKIACRVGKSLETCGNVRPRQMFIQDRTRLTDCLAPSRGLFYAFHGIISIFRSTVIRDIGTDDLNIFLLSFLECKTVFE